MSEALPVDLWTRVLAAGAQGATHRAAAVQFGVSAASISGWRRLERLRGDVWPGPLGGDRRSGRIEAQAEMILLLLDEMRDARCGDRGTAACTWRARPAVRLQDAAAVLPASPHHAQETYGPPRLQVCRETACWSASTYPVSRRLPWPRWIARVTGLIKTTVSSTTFLTRPPRRRIDRYAICSAPPQTSWAAWPLPAAIS